MKIIVDWENIETVDNFYDLFLPQVEAPEWHGRNLDALADSVITGDINKIEPPYTIHNININRTSESILEFQQKVLSIFNECMTEDRGIKVVTE